MDYVGIDLGTTNSAIARYDGEAVTLLKSPDQNDVTPSAIFLDRRGNKYVGARAYMNAARNPDNAATLFKRMMGTSTPIRLPAVDVTMTPEECSAEILRVVFGYLPEDIRQRGETGTVITVPAAFNQMQKDSTMAAAEAAGIGKVALMQEPVAAVMSVMRQRGRDGIFLVFDLGGGTLDIAIAESLKGRVSLLAHGGVEMCGGRDIDRALLDQIVKPWLIDNFNLGEDFSASSQFKSLLRTSTWAAEKAKIELSGSEAAVISLSETEIGVRDKAGDEIYLDIPLNRHQLDELIQPVIASAVTAARETLDRAGISAHDVDRIVFVGGPTQYKPLRDKVAFELGIAASTDVNPMTAVAEGAAIFAESIDWSTQTRGRKASRGNIASGQTDLAFAYVARTPDTQAKVIAKVGSQGVTGAEFQIDSLDTGWSSGRKALVDGASFDVPLTKPGENVFKLFVFDAAGGPIGIAQDRIVISRTAAAIDAIPASHTIGIEALEKRDGATILMPLVRAGDPLPNKGKLTFRAVEALRAGSPSSLNFRLWEGDIREPVTDNNFVGLFRISGGDFEDGLIAAGAEIQLDYQVLDSGNIVLDATVPSIGGSFQSGHNFYSRQEGQIDYAQAAAQVSEEASDTLNRLDTIGERVSDDRIDEIRTQLAGSVAIDRDEGDPEKTKKAMDDIRAAKKKLAEIRKTHLKTIRQIDLDRCLAFFNDHLREIAKPIEIQAFDNLARTAQRSIDSGSNDFEGQLSDLKSKNFLVLWQHDDFVIDRFNHLTEQPQQFFDLNEYERLCQAGRQAIAEEDIDKLRAVVSHLDNLRMGAAGEDDLLASVNIVAG